MLINYWFITLKKHVSDSEPRPNFSNFLINYGLRLGVVASQKNGGATLIIVCLLYEFETSKTGYEERWAN